MAFAKRYGLLILIVIAVLAAGLGWLLRSHPNENKDISPVKADDRILAEGIVCPVHYAELAMPVDGTIGEILVKEGDKVTAGQPVIRLVREDYQSRVGSAHANATGAAAVVEQSKVNMAEAERELQRQERLERAGAATRQKVEQAQTDVVRKQSALVQAQAELTAGEKKVSESQDALDKTELRSPISGTVVFLEVEAGEHAEIGKVLVRIADESEWEVKTDDLTELSVANVKKGNPVDLTFDGIPGLDIAGKVKFVRSYGEKKRGDMTYTVFIAPETWDERLRWNMTAQIAITPLNEVDK
ncbi:HlyD family secretion protein [Sporomusaceae bacterium BoRhaA]|uniref:HlyD family secretion protein n=1 Tax=Pelorhabdus rhamnosifermentans TaxID=2772457 RepID=UPI001C0640E9|nr:efflux RND transporter periplasmic adaptor subunit [Pelorhabdus rhamnosifermentans]MBU2703317.1 HlyD family secretion protein [Pelorhabdus rhamnosifermentans]